MKTIFLLILIAAFTSAHAEDIKLLSGETVKGDISRVEPDGLVVVTSDGITKLKFDSLVPEAQKKYGYDPDKAAAPGNPSPASGAGQSTATTTDLTEHFQHYGKPAQATLWLTPYDYMFTLSGDAYEKFTLAMRAPIGDLDEYSAVLRKCIEWAKIARDTKAVSFEKPLEPLGYHRFSWHADISSALLISGPNPILNEEEIVAMVRLVDRLPGIREKQKRATEAVAAQDANFK